MPLRCEWWMWRWLAGSRASSTLRASSVVCAGPVLQNTGGNLCTRTSRRLERPLYAGSWHPSFVPFTPGCVRRSDKSCNKLLRVPRKNRPFGKLSLHGRKPPVQRTSTSASLSTLTMPRYFHPLHLSPRKGSNPGGLVAVNFQSRLQSQLAAHKN